MSPRPYRLGQRQAASDRTRDRILTAARDLLAAGQGVAGFTVEAVAHRAGVARMTVYHRFGSKSGLLEALFDSLGARGGMGDLAAAFQRDDPMAALDDYLAVFTGFWASDRVVIRRVRALAALDPAFERAVHARDRGRRHAARVILDRVAAAQGRPAPDALETAADVLQLLASFETFDALAGPDRSPADVTELLRRLARSAIGR
jgi:AcrR family transcriptional regulator